MALSKERVEAQIRAIGKFNSFFTRKEIKHLPEVMRDGEEILFMTSGITDGNTWLVTATNLRLLFLDKGMIYGLKQIEYPYEKISTIAHKTGLMFGEIVIGTSSGDVKIETISKADVPKMTEIISNRINALNARTAGAPATQAADDLPAKLERLAALKEKGLLTDAEFAEAKARLIR